MMFEHSEAKVRLLDLYIRKYLNILSRAQGNEKVNLYDLFCGEGIYENGGEGSPIIFLKAIKDVYYSNQASGQKIIQVDCVFNDLKTWKTEKVKSIIESKKLHYPFFGDLRFRNVDYAEAVPLVVDQISKSKKAKAFVFIDPYGYKDVKASKSDQFYRPKKQKFYCFCQHNLCLGLREKGFQWHYKLSSRIWFQKTNGQILLQELISSRT